jgi:hypothetical protein
VEANHKIATFQNKREHKIKKGDPVMGDLIKKTPYSEITATIELLDKLGVTSEDLGVLRKASSWQQNITAAVIKRDFFLLNLLSIEISAKKVGLNKEDFVALTNENLLRDFQGVVRGTHQILPISHIIDCDADPYIPNNWKVEEHQKGGMWQWDVNKISLYLSKFQRKKKSISGNELRKELQGKPVLNANVLDYLLKHPELIPEEWENQYIFFWGTIYRDSDGNFYVRCLRWYGVRWDWYCHWLDVDWNFANPAVLRVS